MLAAQAIRAGDSRVAGGGRAWSRCPTPPSTSTAYRQGVKFGDQTMVDGLIRDGLWCSFCDVPHGRPRGVHRQEGRRHPRDGRRVLAPSSHQKAVAAAESGKFEAEIVPVEMPGRKGPTTVAPDEGPRADTTLEALGRLRPAFPDDAPEDIDEPVVTAGNASSMNDGACGAGGGLGGVRPRQRASRSSRASPPTPPAPRSRGSSSSPPSRRCEPDEQEGTAIGDYDLIEANEAFAVQALADGKGLGWDWDRVNVNGGAVALGHPIGASGARVLTTLLHAMRDRDAEHRPRHALPRRRRRGRALGRARLEMRRTSIA